MHLHQNRPASSGQWLRRHDLLNFITTLYEGDLHAKRVLSLANATLGVLTSASLAIHAVGRGLAQAMGTLTKHGVKQVDRLLSNRGLNVWAFFAYWTPFIVGARTEVVVALDWTSFAADGQDTIVLSMVTGHGSPWQKSRIRPGPGAAEPRRLHGMAMGKRPVARQASPLWVETADLPTSDGHPFFERLNRVLEDCGFDAFVEGLCSAFYAARMGRPSLRPGRYFRMLLIGYFEGLSSERGIAWRVADSLSLRSFLDLELTESAPDHSTLSRTRRLIDVETHEAVFTWVLERLSEAGLVVGKTVGIDATTLEANAAMRSIERRDTGESYEAFIRRLAEASGVETPTRAELARFDRSRKNKKTSNKEWKSPQDPDAKIAKMKDGRTHLAHKAEHGVDMDTGAIVSVTVQDASDGDTATLPETLIMAAEQVEAVQPEGAGVEEVVADKGYHSDETLVGLGEVGVRSHVSEPERGRRCWQDKKTGETPPEKLRRKRCMRTAGVCGGGGVVACNAAEAKWWSVLSRTCMRRAVCVGSGCAATTMSASACCSRRPPATSGCSCAGRPALVRPGACRGGLCRRFTV